MSTKAEGKALAAYPECMVYNDLAMEYEDINGCSRAGFEIGYEQAEKDLALTWEDVRKLCSLSFVVEVELGRYISDKEHYSEVIRRFNEYKSTKQV